MVGNNVSNIRLEDAIPPPLYQPGYRYTLKVRKIYDADTIKGTIDLGYNLSLGVGTKARDWVSIRLLGIDTPEIKSKQSTKAKREAEKALAIAARDYVRGLIPLKSKIVVESHKVDKYGRILGKVYLPDGTCLNERLLVNNFAVAYDGTGNRMWVLDDEEEAI